MSKEFTGKEACIAPEGVFIIGTYDETVSYTHLTLPTICSV